MNYRGFKKVSEDAEKATLVNQRGHQITLAIKQLSKRHQEGIKKLPLYAAEGVDVKNVDEAAPPAAPAMASASGMDAAPVGQATPPAATPMAAMPAPEQAQPQMQQPQLTPQQQYQQGYDETFAKNAHRFGQEAALWGQDLANGHITPKTYQSLYNDQNTIGKAGTLFGLLLSNFGSGLANQPSTVLKMMEQEIANDLEAQKTSKSNAMNYYKANLEKLRTEQEIAASKTGMRKTEKEIEGMAITNAKNQMGLSYLNKITSLNNNLPPDQRAKGDQIIGGMIAPAVDAYIQKNSDQGARELTEAEFQQRNNDLRMAEAYGALPGGSRLAETAERRHYPGIPGQASRDMDKEDTTYINNGIDFDKHLDEFYKWTAEHSGDLSPTDYQTGLTMAAELQAAYRQATNGGVFKEGEQNFISKIIDSKPTKFFNEIRVLPQIKVVSEENKRRLDTKLKGLGFKGYPGHQEKQSKTVKTKWSGGVEYMEGENGEPVPLKKSTGNKTDW